MKNILFYKYVEIYNTGDFRLEQLELCNRLGLKGRIILSTEGINGNLTGTDEDIESYKSELIKDARFSDIQFKEGLTDNHNFKKMIVKIKKEIITSRFDVDLSDKGTYLEPKELKEWYEKGEDFVIIDARNSYEHRYGKFKNSLSSKIPHFTHFPEAVERLKEFKDKKVVTFCTGGIRCEKASALLKKNGFTNVYQLHGGIINYGKECGSEFWEGKCFVFDDREAVDLE